MGNLTSGSSMDRQSASPDAIVDRLFQRLAAMYGAKWLDLWSAIPMDAVKAEWSRALTGHDVEAVRLALEHQAFLAIANQCLQRRFHFRINRHYRSSFLGLAFTGRKQEYPLLVPFNLLYGQILDRGAPGAGVIGQNNEVFQIALRTSD